MNKNSICYMCKAKAITKEHVPPKCLFPERKDVGTDTFRKNLITVPSCADHNTGKSKDDEFLMISIAGILGNNSIGYIHNHTKVNRALSKKAYKQLDEIFIKKHNLKFKLKNNKFVDLIWGTPDYSRLMNCFSHIAYGVYYHHFKKSFEGEIEMIPSFVVHKDRNNMALNKLVEYKSELELKNQEKHGANKDIFYYQFLKPDEHAFIGFKLCFYDNVTVYGSYIPSNSSKTFNLELELINAGFHTTIDIDNDVIEFNKK